MSRINFIKEKRVIEAEPGENLLSLMRRAGMNPDAPCGGNGKCGKCKVGIAAPDKDMPEETVLACKTEVSGDLSVWTGGSTDAQVLVTGRGAGTVFDPALREISVHVRPCPEGESISEWTRFTEGLEKAGYPVRPLPDPQIASALGSFAREGKQDLFALMFEDRVLRISDSRESYYMAAFDIGTTTLAAYLLDGADGKVLTTASRLNPQKQYGGDVINRANYTLEHGMKEVTECVHEAVNAMIAEMTAEIGASVSDVYAVSVAGNTCMHHLFLGITVDTLVHAPYNPAVQEAMILKAADYGIIANPRCRLLMLPNIAGFVGADTVACLVSSDLAEQEEWTLLIDIGTNGEMVLGKNHSMIACSTAAGPAFEGAGISCGMRGEKGAVSKAKYVDGKWEFEVIGNGKIRGICGSGLLDMASELLVSGQMDENGAMEGESSILLADEKTSADGKEIRLLQKDIGELRLAKAAIASGIRLLAQKKGIEITDISTVWLAGAFGSFLSPESACNIGLIPPELRGRITAIGNAAGEGAKIVLQNREKWDKCAELVAEAEFLELAGMDDFQDCFVDELIFPEI